MFKRIAVTSALALTLAAGMHAAALSFVIQGTATGTVGASAFTNALLTMTLSADTADISGPCGPACVTQPTDNVPFSIAGAGSGVFTTKKTVFVNNQTHLAGITDPVRSDIMDLSSPVFLAYDLKSPIGPISDPNPLSGNFTAIASSLGTINLSSAGPFTFQAVAGGPASAPEPALGWLIGPALFLLTLKRAS